MSLNSFVDSDTLPTQLGLASVVDLLPESLRLLAIHWPLFLEGTENTIILLVLAGSLATAMAIPLAVIRARHTPIVSEIVAAYVYVFRGTPLLVQLYLLYYGVAQFPAVRESFLWPVLREPWWCAIIALSICSAAYMTEVFRGSIESVPYGETEAARACGMSEFMVLRKIVFPSAMRRALPAYSNEVIFVLHGSVVASTITIIDALGAGRKFNHEYYLAFEGLLASALIYMVMVYIIVRLFRLIERRLRIAPAPVDQRPIMSLYGFDRPGIIAINDVDFQSRMQTEPVKQTNPQE